MSDNRVKVGVRVRPLLGMELEAGADSVIRCSATRVAMSVPSKKNTFDFDWSFGPNASHREVYTAVCQPLIKSIFEGFNATVFAYGQTGSGKTFTMGNGADATEGVIPFAIDDIFEQKRRCEARSMAVQLDMSFMEVYMEDCYDLLSADRNRVDLRETAKGETYPEGLTIRPVTSAEDVRNFLSEAAQVRSTGRTAMNAHSSRSHAICTFYLRVIESAAQALAEGQEDFSRAIVSKLHLVDLAGSERAKKTQATGDVFAEGVSINKGLLALGNVIVALSTQGKDGHVPYRDSKITRLLKDSLGGNGRTVMLACASPADVNFEETLNTLRFASRASTIVNSAHVNIDESDLVMDDGRALPPSVAKELVFLRTQNATLQQQVDSMGAIMGGCDGKDSTFGAADRAMLLDSAKLLLSGVMEMVGAQKSLLVKCLADDFTLDEKEVQSMTETINKAKELIGMYMSSIKESTGGIAPQRQLTAASDCEDSNMSMDLSFLPPIMKLIEDLEKLQDTVNSAMEALSGCVGGEPTNRSQIKHRKKKHIKAAPREITKRSADSEFDMEGSALDAITAACGEDGENDIEAAYDDGGSDDEASECWSEDFAADEAAAMQEKDANVLNIIKIAEQYKATILALRSEISSLESEKTQLALKEAKEKKINPVSAPATKVQKELLEKTKALDAKLKQLRQKEVEYARIYQEKERARKEADQLRGELTDALKKRVVAAKRLKEESDQHQVERKRLQQAEMQSRRRELQAQSTVQKLNKEFSNRERVLRGQLEEKEREVKRQKELILKQQKVKAAREAAPSKRFSGLGAGALGVKAETVGASAASGGNEFSVSSQRAAALDVWLSQEVASQAKRNYLADDIEGMMESRAKISRKLHTLKAQRGAAETMHGTCTFIREAEVKHMEEEVRAKSIALARHQGMLADLGTVVEKRRFAGVTDPKETKYIMHWMFQKLSKDGPLSLRLLELKISTQDEQIEQLKRQLAAAEGQVQQMTDHLSSDPALEMSGGSLSTAAEVSEFVFRKRSGSSISSAEMIDSGDGKQEEAEETAPLKSQVPGRPTASAMRNKVLMTARSVNAAISSIKDTKHPRPVILPNSLPASSQTATKEGSNLLDVSHISADDSDFDDFSVDEDPMDESFRPPTDDDSDYDDEEFRRKAHKKKTGNRKGKSSAGSSPSISGVKRSIGDISEESANSCTDEEPSEPATKRFSPMPCASPIHTVTTHFSRRRSIGGTPGDCIKVPTPGRQSLAGGMLQDKRSAGTRKLRRASVAGASDLEFVHTDFGLTDSFDKENSHNDRENLIPPNIESYSVRDLKDLLATRGLIQSGKKSDLIARLRVHAGYHFN